MTNKEAVRARFAKILSNEHSNVSYVGPEGLMILGIGALLDDQPVTDTSYPDVFGDVNAFHTRFKQEYHGPPRGINHELYWRVKFIQEEFKEMTQAIKAKDLAKQFDAGLDIVYVTLGLMILQGFPFNEGWKRVHESNMTKMYVPPNTTGKYGQTVAKGPDFRPVDLSDLVDGGITHEG